MVVGGGEIRHDLFVGALPPERSVERGRSVASPGCRRQIRGRSGGRLVSDTKYVQTTWRLDICLTGEGGGGIHLAGDC